MKREISSHSITRFHNANYNSNKWFVPCMKLNLFRHRTTSSSNQIFPSPAISLFHSRVHRILRSLNENSANRMFTKSKCLLFVGIFANFDTKKMNYHLQFEQRCARMAIYMKFFFRLIHENRHTHNTALPIQRQNCAFFQ